MKRCTKTSRLKNKKMDSGVYAERTKVMECLYALKKIADFGRVEVRITKNGQAEDRNLLGLGRMTGFVIWIPERTLTSSYLYQVVAHELLHAVKGLGHNEKCQLMSSVVRASLTKAEVNTLFKAYMTNNLKPAKAA